MKKVLSLLIVLAMVISMVPAVFATGTSIITSHPSDVTAMDGTLAVFSVTAEGEGLTYQWQYKTTASGAVWTNSSSSTKGYNESTLSVGAVAKRDGYSYRCRVTDASGTKYYSDAAVLTVTENTDPIRFTANPVDETVKLGTRANFTVETAGNGVDAVTYQWQYQITPGGAWWNATVYTMGYNTKTLNVIGAEKRDGYKYRCRMTDAIGNKYYSEVAILTVDMPDVYGIVEDPVDAYVIGSNKTQFHVETQGEGLTYQWEYNSAGGASTVSWWAMGSTTGCKTDTLTIAGVSGSTNRDGYAYRCIVTDPDGYIMTSEFAILHVTTADIQAQPEDQYVAVGGNAVFTAVTGGDVAGYQWEYSNNGGTSWWTSSTTGNKSNSITVGATAARNGNLYRLKITDSEGNILYTRAAKLIVDTGADVTITANPESVTADVGQTVTFTGAATGDDVKYQWYMQKAGSDEWFTVVGETAASMSIVATAEMNGYAYKLVATDASGATAESSVATLSVVTATPLEIVTQPSVQWVALGENAEFSVVANGDGLTYQWQTMVDYEWADIEGANAATLTVAATEDKDSTQYQCVITDKYGETVTTDSATLMIEYPEGSANNPEFVTFEMNETYTEGTATVTVPAGETRYFQAYGVAGMTLSVNGDKYADLPAGNPRVPAVFSLTNNTEADAEYALHVAAPVGTEGNPEVVEYLGWHDLALPENSSGYYYTYTAPADGTVKLWIGTVAPEGVEVDMVVNKGQYVLSADGVADEWGTLVLSLDAVAGQEFSIMLTVMPDADWNYPAAEFDWHGEFTYPVGTENNPEQVEFTDNGDGTYSATVTVAAGETRHFTAFGIGGTTLTVNGEDYGTMVGYAPTFALTNETDAAAEYVLVATYPVGTYQNPEKITDLGDLVYNHVAGDGQGYYYSYVATEAGTLNITASTEEAGVEFDITLHPSYKTLLADAVDGVLSLDVAEGDEIMIQICTTYKYQLDDNGEIVYDEYDWPIVLEWNPAAEINVNIALEGEDLSDVEIDETLPSLPEDGEEN